MATSKMAKVKTTVLTPATPAVQKINNIEKRFASRLIGQPKVVETITPYIHLFEANLNMPDRPVGVFLLLGPTGTGKTKTVEALAETLHGSRRSLLKIDCGEFQMEHEVAKLIGAPPGYLGHRETQPLITQQKLASVTSESSNLSLVLFDEIEKAAPSMTRLLLGILDKATLTLGDNSKVNLERSMIFLTSNLGAKDMQDLLNPHFGFSRVMHEEGKIDFARLESIGEGAVKRKFSPEFVNRIDGMLTFQPLDSDSINKILELEIQDLNKHLSDREKNFRVSLTQDAKDWLIERGVSKEFGARELKRVILRELLQPLSHHIRDRQIEEDVEFLLIDVDDDKLTFE